MSGTLPLPTSGILRVQAVEDLTLDGGTWHLATDQQGTPIAHIGPPSVPMFQQVVAYLESKPVPPGGSTRRADEARAATAVCLRWGSYFALLADPARPPAPNIDDEQVSQIADAEMARMDIEISAAVAWWLTLAGSDDRRHWDLVARAQAYLPTGPKAVNTLQGGDILLASTMPEMAAELHRQWPADRLERDMQATVPTCWQGKLALRAGEGVVSSGRSCDPTTKGMDHGNEANNHCSRDGGVSRHLRDCPC
jgi:hypothetical protein